MRVGDRLDVRGPSAVRFRGTGRTAFLDNRQFHGNAFALLRAAERFLRDSLPIPGRIEEGRVERIDCLLGRSPRTEGIGRNLQTLVKSSRRTADRSRQWNGT